VSIANGRMPIKVVSPQFVTADNVAVIGFVLTNSGAAAVGQATIQDGNNNDTCKLNTTVTRGMAPQFYPNPISMAGLSVPSFSGTGAILYIYLADI
jgi:hypothetical protein